MLSSTSRILPNPVIDTTLDIQGFIDPKDKLNELQGTFKYGDKRVRIIRDLTETHEVTWEAPDKTAPTVYVKYLRYATIIESDIHMTPDDKRRELKRILNQMIHWTSLKHPNILPFLGYQWKDTPVLVFSWYKNGNISQYLKAHPDFDRLKL
ncbi:hypothetical protein FRC00_014711, partial [Tulasnella sp. 408]